MKGLPRITEIIKVEPVKITVRWTTGEIRVLDFADLLVNWGISPNDDSDLAHLYNYDTFKVVTVAESKTLQWPTVLISHLSFNENGAAVRTTSPLLLDPEVLYTASRSLEDYRLVPVTA